MAKTLSSRGARVLAAPKPAFSTVYYENLKKLYDPVARPAGVLNLAVAENKLAAPLIMRRIQEAGSGASAESLAYNPYAGSDRLRSAVARVASKHVARRLLDPDRLILTNGAGSALWLLASVLLDPGQGVLVPVPYYYAYDRDMCALTECRLVPVDATHGDPLSPESLSLTARSAAAEGTACRLLLITNPSNPTGEVLSIGRLRAAIEWAATQGIEVIVNELYACSARPGFFDSVLSIYSDRNGRCDLPGHVHFVWGLSKDFAVNGLRCGCIYSGSQEVFQASSKFAYFFQVGGTVQAQLAECLEDDAWVDDFLVESRRLVGEATEATMRTLRRVGAPFAPPAGGLFVWADLRRWAVAAGGELALFEHLAKLPGGGVLLCPGGAFRACEGWFRICVTAAPAGHLEAGLARLEAGLRSLA